MKSSSLYFIAGVISVAALSCQQRQSPDCGRIEVLNIAAKKLIFTTPDSAFKISSQALQLSEKEDCLSGAGESHQVIGTVLYHQGVYQESLRHLLQAESIFNDLNSISKVSECRNQLGLVYYNIKQPDLALRQHQQALASYTQIKDEKGIAYSEGCIGRIYEKRQNYEQALAWQQKALAFYQRNKDHQGMAVILENIGSIYEDQHAFAKALTCFTESLRLTEMTGDSLTMILDINNIGDNYRKTNQFAKALEWTQKAVALAARLNDKYQLSSAYKDLSKIYGAAGDFQNAYKNLEVGRNLYQDMYTQDASRQVALFQTLFEIERKNHEIQVLTTDNTVNTAIKIVLASFIALIALLTTVIISRQRLRIRQNRELIQQNAQIYETQSKLLHVEIENTHLHEQKLQNELDSKAKSLTSHTLHIISKNKVLESIQTRLNELLKEGPGDNRKPLKSLVKMIEHNFVQDKDWDDFRLIFEQVHQDFFHRLQQKAPDLTPGDLRLASLIRLNIPSKDISVVLGISQDSLRIARYRLRKKLLPDQRESLTHFIGSL